MLLHMVVITCSYSMRQLFIAGMVAGLYSAVVYAPVERVKCVMQVSLYGLEIQKYIDISCIVSFYVNISALIQS